MQNREFDMLRELMARRRDVRRFRTTELDEAELEKVFELVELSPSVGNSQPWRWVRVKDVNLRAQVQDHFEATNKTARTQVSDEKRANYDRLKLAGLKEAPVQYAVFCDPMTTQGSGLGQQTHPEMLHYSVVCAVMAFWLGAKARGIGVGWVSILEGSEVARLLDVPSNWDLVAYLCVGYPIEEHYDPELERFGWQDRVWQPAHILRR